MVRIVQWRLKSLDCEIAPCTGEEVHGLGMSLSWCRAEVGLHVNVIAFQEEEE